MALWVPTFMKDMLPYIQNPNVGGMYGMWDSPTPGLHPDGSVTPGEGGVDLTSPIGTPVYALASGPIVGAGYWNDENHGVVTTRVQVPGAGTQDLYYQHIILDPSITQCVGNACTQSVVAGQKIGTVGGYGETEVGFNAKWGGIWGDNHPGPWFLDPRPLLAALLTQTPINPALLNSTNVSMQAGGQTPVTNNLPDWSIKVGLFLLALILLALGTWILFKKQIVAGTKRVVNAGVAIGTGGTDVEADKAALTGQ